ncbi:hypothetical protein T09_11743, partial [Trichinella sp. T9]
ANANGIVHNDIVQSFNVLHVQLGNFTWFSRLNGRFNDKRLSEYLKRKIKAHLTSLQYKNPSLVNVEHLPHDFQEVAIESQFNILDKDSFEVEYSKIISQILRILVPFSSTYLCETGFIGLMTLNMQHRNRLKVECNFRRPLLE